MSRPRASSGRSPPEEEHVERDGIGWVAVACVVVLVAGCSGGAILARRATTPAPELRADEAATLVLMRPGRWARDIRLRIADGTGRTLADVATHEWSVVRVSPGPIELVMRVGWRDPMFNGVMLVDFRDRIEGVVAAGRVYFVYVGATPGGGRLEVMRPGHAQWETREQLLGQMTRVEVDEAAAAAYFGAHRAELAEMLAHGREHWVGLDDAHRFERTIFPTDGM
jgi:hypothetical protein